MPRFVAGTPFLNFVFIIPQQLYVNGEEESDITIEGGIFRNNKAYEMGGAIAASGAAALVTIAGGRLESNHAR